MADSVHDVLRKNLDVSFVAGMSINDMLRMKVGGSAPPGDTDRDLLARYSGSSTAKPGDSIRDILRKLAAGTFSPFDLDPELWVKALAAGASAPASIGAPSIDNNTPSGVGITLTATPGTYSNSPTGFVRQWKRDGVDIAGETGLTYTTASDDQGHNLSFYEKATNTLGDSGFIRATTGLPRPFFISGDSLWSDSQITTDLQAALGSGWLVTNVAHSGDNVSDMEAKAVSLVDPFIQVGYGVSFFHEYANTVTGVQGSDSGASTFAQLQTFGQNRQSAGAIAISSTCYYRAGAVKDGTQAHIASELMRAGFATCSSAFVDIDVSGYLTSADANDGVHWQIASDATLRASVITLLTNVISALGLTGGGGDIPIPNPPAANHLRTHSNAGYIYDPVNPLPNPLPYPTTYVRVLSGAGWDLGSFHVTGLIDSFPTADGNQRLWSIDPSQTTPSLSGGTYEIASSP